mgnify:CR=1 FL=1
MNRLTKVQTTPLILLITLVSALIFFQGCDQEQAALEDETAVPVTLATAQTMQGGNMQTFAGNVESDNQANLSTIVMGTVEVLSVSVGQNVQQGEVLARIKDDQIRAKKMQLEANMVQANANLENTEKNYERIKNLYAEESATSKELDDISTMYDIAKANLDALEASLNEVNEMLEYTVIRAPFDGIVSHKFVSEGDMASPGHPLLSIADPGSIKITANVPERWIGRISEGDTVSVAVAAAGIESTEAVLTAVSKAGDPMSRQYAIEAQLLDENAADGLKTGMFAEIMIEADGNASLFIPVSALTNRGQLTGIFTISDSDRTVLRWVRTGKRSGDTVEILTGLEPGEQYISGADQALQQGQLVSIQ